MSQILIKSVLRQQNEDLIKKIAQKYELDADDLLSKYLRPSFFLPVENKSGITVEYVDKNRRFKDTNSIESHNASRTTIS